MKYIIYVIVWTINILIYYLCVAFKLIWDFSILDYESYYKSMFDRSSYRGRYAYDYKYPGSPFTHLKWIMTYGFNGRIINDDKVNNNKV